MPSNTGTLGGGGKGGASAASDMGHSAFFGVKPPKAMTRAELEAFFLQHSGGVASPASSDPSSAADKQQRGGGGGGLTAASFSNIPSNYNSATSPYAPHRAGDGEFAKALLESTRRKLVVRSVGEDAPAHAEGDGRAIAAELLAEMAVGGGGGNDNNNSITNTFVGKPNTFAAKKMSPTAASASMAKGSDASAALDADIDDFLSSKAKDDAAAAAAVAVDGGEDSPYEPYADPSDAPAAPFLFGAPRRLKAQQHYAGGSAGEGGVAVPPFAGAKTAHANFTFDGRSATTGVPIITPASDALRGEGGEGAGGDSAEEGALVDVPARTRDLVRQAHAIAARAGHPSGSPQRGAPTGGGGAGGPFGRQQIASSEADRDVHEEQLYLAYVQLQEQQDEIDAQRRKLGWDQLTGNFMGITAVLEGGGPSADDAEALRQLGDWETYNKVQESLKTFIFRRAPESDKQEGPDFVAMLKNRLHRARETIDEQRKAIGVLTDALKVSSREAKAAQLLAKEQSAELHRLKSLNTTLMVQMRQMRAHNQHRSGYQPANGAAAHQQNQQQLSSASTAGGDHHHPIAPSHGQGSLAEQLATLRNDFMELASAHWKAETENRMLRAQMGGGAEGGGPDIPLLRGGANGSVLEGTDGAAAALGGGKQQPPAVPLPLPPAGRVGGGGGPTGPDRQKYISAQMQAHTRAVIALSNGRRAWRRRLEASERGTMLSMDMDANAIGGEGGAVSGSSGQRSPAAGGSLALSLQRTNMRMVELAKAHLGEKERRQREENNKRHGQQQSLLSGGTPTANRSPSPYGALDGSPENHNGQLTAATDSSADNNSVNSSSGGNNGGKRNGWRILHEKILSNFALSRAEVLRREELHVRRLRHKVALLSEELAAAAADRDLIAEYYQAAEEEAEGLHAALVEAKGQTAALTAQLDAWRDTNQKIQSGGAGLGLAVSPSDPSAASSGGAASAPPSGGGGFASMILSGLDLEGLTDEERRSLATDGAASDISAAAQLHALAGIFNGRMAAAAKQLAAKEADVERLLRENHQLAGGAMGGSMSGDGPYSIVLPSSGGSNSNNNAAAGSSGGFAMVTTSAAVLSDEVRRLEADVLKKERTLIAYEQEIKRLRVAAAAHHDEAVEGRAVIRLGLSVPTAVRVVSTLRARARRAALRVQQRRAEAAKELKAKEAAEEKARRRELRRARGGGGDDEDSTDGDEDGGGNSVSSKRRGGLSTAAGAGRMGDADDSASIGSTVTSARRAVQQAKGALATEKDIVVQLLFLARRDDHRDLAQSLLDGLTAEEEALASHAAALSASSNAAGGGGGVSANPLLLGGMAASMSFSVASTAAGGLSQQQPARDETTWCAARRLWLRLITHREERWRDANTVPARLAAEQRVTDAYASFLQYEQLGDSRAHPSMACGAALRVISQAAAPVALLSAGGAADVTATTSAAMSGAQRAAAGDVGSAHSAAGHSSDTDSDAADADDHDDSAAAQATNSCQQRGSQSAHSLSSSSLALAKGAQQTKGAIATSKQQQQQKGRGPLVAYTIADADISGAAEAAARRSAEAVEREFQSLSALAKARTSQLAHMTEQHDAIAAALRRANASAPSGASAFSSASSAGGGLMGDDAMVGGVGPSVHFAPSTAVSANSGNSPNALVPLASAMAASHGSDALRSGISSASASVAFAPSGPHGSGPSASSSAQSSKRPSVSVRSSQRQSVLVGGVSLNVGGRRGMRRATAHSDFSSSQQQQQWSVRPSSNILYYRHTTRSAEESVAQAAARFGIADVPSLLAAAQSFLPAATKALLGGSGGAGVGGARRTAAAAGGQSSSASVAVMADFFSLKRPFYIPLLSLAQLEMSAGCGIGRGALSSQQHGGGHHNNSSINNSAINGNGGDNQQSSPSQNQCFFIARHTVRPAEDTVASIAAAYGVPIDCVCFVGTTTSVAREADRLRQRTGVGQGDAAPSSAVAASAATRGGSGTPEPSSAPPSAAGRPSTPPPPQNGAADGQPAPSSLLSHDPTDGTNSGDNSASFVDILNDRRFAQIVDVKVPTSTAHRLLLSSKNTSVASSSSANNNNGAAEVTPMLLVAYHPTAAYFQREAAASGAGATPASATPSTGTGTGSADAQLVATVSLDAIAAAHNVPIADLVALNLSPREAGAPLWFPAAIAAHTAHIVAAALAAPFIATERETARLRVQERLYATNSVGGFVAPSAFGDVADPRAQSRNSSTRGGGGGNKSTSSNSRNANPNNTSSYADGDDDGECSEWEEWERATAEWAAAPEPDGSGIVLVHRGGLPIPSPSSPSASATPSDAIAEGLSLMYGLPAAPLRALLTADSNNGGGLLRSLETAASGGREAVAIPLSLPPSVSVSGGDGGGEGSGEGCGLFSSVVARRAGLVAAPAVAAVTACYNAFVSPREAPSGAFPLLSGAPRLLPFAAPAPQSLAGQSSSSVAALTSPLSSPTRERAVPAAATGGEGSAPHPRPLPRRLLTVRGLQVLARHAYVSPLSLSSSAAVEGALRCDAASDRSVRRQLLSPTSSSSPATTVGGGSRLGQRPFPSLPITASSAPLPTAVPPALELVPPDRCSLLTIAMTAGTLRECLHIPNVALIGGPSYAATANVNGNGAATGTIFASSSSGAAIGSWLVAIRSADHLRACRAAGPAAFALHAIVHVHGMSLATLAVRFGLPSSSLLQHNAEAAGSAAGDGTTAGGLFADQHAPLTGYLRVPIRSEAVLARAVSGGGGAAGLFSAAALPPSHQQRNSNSDPTVIPSSLFVGLFAVAPGATFATAASVAAAVGCDVSNVSIFDGMVDPLAMPAPAIVAMPMPPAAPLLSSHTSSNSINGPGAANCLLTLRFTHPRVTGVAFRRRSANVDETVGVAEEEGYTYEEERFDGPLGRAATVLEVDAMLGGSRLRSAIEADIVSILQFIGASYEQTSTAARGGPEGAGASMSTTAASRSAPPATTRGGSQREAFTKTPPPPPPTPPPQHVLYVSSIAALSGPFAASTSASVGGEGANSSSASASHSPSAPSSPVAAAVAADPSLAALNDDAPYTAPSSSSNAKENADADEEVLVIHAVLSSYAAARAAAAHFASSGGACAMPRTERALEAMGQPDGLTLSLAAAAAKATATEAADGTVNRSSTDPALASVADECESLAMVLGNVPASALSLTPLPCAIEACEVVAFSDDVDGATSSYSSSSSSSPRKDSTLLDVCLRYGVSAEALLGLNPSLAFALSRPSGAAADTDPLLVRAMGAAMATNIGGSGNQGVLHWPPGAPFAAHAASSLEGAGGGGQSSGANPPTPPPLHTVASLCAGLGPMGGGDGRKAAPVATPQSFRVGNALLMPISHFVPSLRVPPVACSFGKMPFFFAACSAPSSLSHRVARCGGGGQSLSALATAFGCAPHSLRIAVASSVNSSSGLVVAPGACLRLPSRPSATTGGGRSLAALDCEVLARSNTAALNGGGSSNAALLASADARERAVGIGESLAEVAEEAGLSPWELALLNPSVVHIAPGAIVGVPMTSSDAADTTGGNTSTPTSPSFFAPHKGFVARHIVQPYETLLSVCGRYGQGLPSLLRANPSLFAVSGAVVLLVPIVGDARRERLLQSEAANLVTIVVPSAYDTAANLSRRFDIPLAALADANKLVLTTATSTSSSSPPQSSSSSSAAHVGAEMTEAELLAQQRVFVPVVSALGRALARQQRLALFAAVGLKPSETVVSVADRYGAFAKDVMVLGRRLLNIGVKQLAVPISAAAAAKLADTAAAASSSAASTNSNTTNRSASPYASCSVFYCCEPAPHETSLDVAASLRSHLVVATQQQQQQSTAKAGLKPNAAAADSIAIAVVASPHQRSTQTVITEASRAVASLPLLPASAVGGSGGGQSPQIVSTSDEAAHSSHPLLAVPITSALLVAAAVGREAAAAAGRAQMASRLEALSQAMRALAGRSDATRREFAAVEAVRAALQRQERARARRTAAARAAFGLTVSRSSLVAGAAAGRASSKANSNGSNSNKPALLAYNQTCSATQTAPITVLGEGYAPPVTVPARAIVTQTELRSSAIDYMAAEGLRAEGRAAEARGAAEALRAEFARLVGQKEDIEAEVAALQEEVYAQRRRDEGRIASLTATVAELQQRLGITASLSDDGAGATNAAANTALDGSNSPLSAGGSSGLATPASSAATVSPSGPALDPTSPAPPPQRTPLSASAFKRSKVNGTLSASTRRQSPPAAPSPSSPRRRSVVIAAPPDTEAVSDASQSPLTSPTTSGRKASGAFAAVGGGGAAGSLSRSSSLSPAAAVTAVSSARRGTIAVTSEGPLGPHTRSIAVSADLRTIDERLGLSFSAAAASASERTAASHGGNAVAIRTAPNRDDGGALAITTSHRSFRSAPHSAGTDRAGSSFAVMGHYGSNEDGSVTDGPLSTSGVYGSGGSNNGAVVHYRSAADARRLRSVAVRLDGTANRLRGDLAALKRSLQSAVAEMSTKTRVMLVPLLSPNVSQADIDRKVADMQSARQEEIDSKIAEGVRIITALLAPQMAQLFDGLKKRRAINLAPFVNHSKVFSTADEKNLTNEDWVEKRLAQYVSDSLRSLDYNIPAAAANGTPTYASVGVGGGGASSPAASDGGGLSPQALLLGVGGNGGSESPNRYGSLADRIDNKGGGNSSSNDAALQQVVDCESATARRRSNMVPTHDWAVDTADLLPPGLLPPLKASMASGEGSALDSLRASTMAAMRQALEDMEAEEEARRLAALVPKGINVIDVRECPLGPSPRDLALQLAQQRTRHGATAEGDAAPSSSAPASSLVSRLHSGFASTLPTAGGAHQRLMAAAEGRPSSVPHGVVHRPDAATANTNGVIGAPRTPAPPSSLPLSGQHLAAPQYQRPRAREAWADVGKEAQSSRERGLAYHHQRQQYAASAPPPNLLSASAASASASAFVAPLSPSALRQLSSVAPSQRSQAVLSRVFGEAQQHLVEAIFGPSSASGAAPSQSHRFSLSVSSPSVLGGNAGQSPMIGYIAPPTAASFSVGPTPMAGALDPHTLVGAATAAASQGAPHAAASPAASSPSQQLQRGAGALSLRGEGIGPSHQTLGFSHPIGHHHHGGGSHHPHHPPLTYGGVGGGPRGSIFGAAHLSHAPHRPPDVSPNSQILSPDADEHRATIAMRSHVALMAQQGGGRGGPPPILTRLRASELTAGEKAVIAAIRETDERIAKEKAKALMRRVGASIRMRRLVGRLAATTAQNRVLDFHAAAQQSAPTAPLSPSAEGPPQDQQALLGASGSTLNGAASSSLSQPNGSSAADAVAIARLTRLWQGWLRGWATRRTSAVDQQRRNTAALAALFSTGGPGDGDGPTSAATAYTAELRERERGRVGSIGGGGGGNSTPASVAKALDALHSFGALKALEQQQQQSGEAPPTVRPPHAAPTNLSPHRSGMGMGTRSVFSTAPPLPTAARQPSSTHFRDVQLPSGAPESPQ